MPDFQERVNLIVYVVIEVVNLRVVEGYRDTREIWCGTGIRGN